MHSPLPVFLFLLQLFQVLHLALHDLLPLGRLSDRAAIRAGNPGHRLWLVALLNAGPFVVPLAGSARHLFGHYPGWLVEWIGIAYGILFLGELRAWWFPYLFGATPERTARRRALFGGTHAFLPERHGITVNTLHMLLHMATLATLIVLAVYAKGR